MDKYELSELSFTMGDLSPNPAYHKAYMEIITPTANQISYTIYDYQQKVVIQNMTQEIPAGNSVLEIDLSLLKQGLYFLEMSIGQYRVVKKLLKINQ